MSQSNGAQYNFKVVLLGEGCVGKTSILLRYVEDKFNPKHLTTLQASFLNKKINIDGMRINLTVWDTAGQERFHALGPIYYRGSDGAVLVYDVTDSDSFEKVKTWVKELRKMLGSDIILLIVGNKTDLERTVNIESAQEYAKEVGANYHETSAKLNEGVEELFLNLSNLMILANNSKSNTLNRRNSTRRGNALVVEEQNEEPAELTGRRCCSSQ